MSALFRIGLYLRRRVIDDGGSGAVAFVKSGKERGMEMNVAPGRVGRDGTSCLAAAVRQRHADVTVATRRRRLCHPPSVRRLPPPPRASRVKKTKFPVGILVGVPQNVPSYR